MPTIDDRFKMRRGTAADLAAVNEVPLKGEWIWEEDQGLGDGKFKLKIGDGVTHYNDLKYLASGGGIEDIVEGSHIVIDKTDPKNPVIGVSGLTVSSSYAEGTSFPGSPALDDKFYRTDLNLLCYYDGTRWLTAQEYTVSMANNGSGDASPPVLRGITLGTNAYFTRCSQSIRVPGINNSTNYVTTVISWSDGTNNNTIASSDTKADSFGAGNIFVFKSFAVDSVAFGVRELDVTTARVGAAGNPYSIIQVGYRLIVT